MKIGIITIHYGFNFGSALQAYALSNFINTQLTGVNAKLIKYIPPRYSIYRRYFATNKYKNNIKKMAYLFITMPFKLRNQWIFDRFLDKYIPMTKKINNIYDARNVTGRFDGFITGSDQVWNSDYNEGIDPMYYLEFASATQKKFSYAASCGRDDISSEEWDIIDEYLKSFSGISLRERNTTKSFRDKGYHNAIQSLDPIFLLNKEEWKKIEKRPHTVISEYVLIYCLDSDEDELIRVAKEIANNRKLKIAIISYSHVWNRYDVDYIYRNQSPNNFLWLISHASYVVTNSFHGVAFSINLEKQFVAVKRKRYNNRLDSILETMNLLNRYVIQQEYFKMKDDIDYDKINIRKNSLIKDAVGYLQLMLED